MQSKKETILLLVPGFPKDEADDTCIPALQELVCHAATTQSAPEIVVIAFQYPLFRGKYRWHNVTVFSCGGANKSRFGRLRTWLRAIRAAVQLRKTHRIAAVHSFWLMECAFVGQMLVKLFGVPHIASAMGQDVFPQNRYRKWLRFSRMILTAPSQSAADIFFQTNQIRVSHVISIGIDPQKFPLKAGLPYADIDVLGVGSLIPLKNYRLFIEMIERLSADFPDLNSVIIGEGGEQAELVEIVREKSLEKQVRFTGKLSRSEVLAQMKRSRILLHPSTYESQGYVFYEALACGLTTVSFAVGMAKPSAKMRVCRDEAEMLQTLRELLRQKPDRSPLVLKPIRESVVEFMKLYEKTRNGLDRSLPENIIL